MQKMTQTMHEKSRNAASYSLYKTHAVLCSKITDVKLCMEWKFVTLGLENLFIFGKVSDFYYTSRLSHQNGEICLEKYSPISDKLSITNY